MSMLLDIIGKLSRVLCVGFYVLGGELRRALLRVYAPDKAEALLAVQVARRVEKFGLDPESSVFFQGN